MARPKVSVVLRHAPLVDLRQVRDVHLYPGQLFWVVVVVDRAPVRLDRDPFLSDDGLDLAHHLAPLIRIGKAVGLGQKRVEFGIGPAKFVLSMVIISV